MKVMIMLHPYNKYLVFDSACGFEKKKRKCTPVAFFYSLLCSLLAMFSVLFPHECTASPYLEGIVISGRTGLPLDSVRVASVLYNTVSITGKDGRFELQNGQHRRSSQEPQKIDSFDEYSIQITSTSNNIKIRSERNKPITVSLIDMNGRTVQKKVLNSSNTSFPERGLACGVYLMNVPDQRVARILVTNNGPHRHIGKTHQVVSKNILPTPGRIDSIVFCKENHSSFVASIDQIRNNEAVSLWEKRRLAFDLHNHTLLTDGSYMQDSVLTHSFNEGGLDVYVNSEHGGWYYRDTSGNYFDNGVPRWYSLIFNSWPKLLGQRTKYPDKIILQGLEWNCPGHEHASVGFIDDAVQPAAIAQFEYQFDFNDNNNGMSWLTKQNGYQHANAIAGLTWLQDNYPSSSYCFVNHPSREAIGPYNVEHFRDFHNAAPDVFLGLEGMPGHHKNSMRGSYGRGREPRHRTWGGADYVIARIGGLWDALLGEGRHLWIIVNSDFHTNTTDFWPGEYAKTQVAVSDTGARAWLEGMRSGDMFITHGDLISDLDFSVDDGINRVVMGEDLYTDTTNLAVTIRFKSPPVNNNGDSVKVDHVDLIAGSITGRIDPGDQTRYKAPVNLTTSAVRRFSAGDWTTENGWKVIRATVSCTEPTYFRLRGTNLATGTPGETDNDGNPLMDEDVTNTEQKAWGDLWFYSNPIFVYR